MYISQNGTEDEVIEYMNNNNLNRLNLNLMAWRLKNAGFAKRVLALLNKRNHYNATSYSYALLHNVQNQAAEYVKFSNFSNHCGMHVSTKLLTVDPVERFRYQHREYSPMVNARTYQLGAKRKIVNREFRQQYNDYMSYLAWKLKVSAEDKLAHAYYLLLQDRIDDGIKMFQSVRRMTSLKKFSTTTWMPTSSSILNSLRKLLL